MSDKKPEPPGIQRLDAEDLLAYPPVSARDVADIIAKRDEELRVRQSRDKAQYVRQQKGHSLVLHLIFGGIVLWIPAIYISVSPNHYWHA